MPQSRRQTYNLSDLIRDCGQEGAVWISGGAVESARRDFSLATDGAIREFIQNDGLKEPSFIRTAPWENNPNRDHVTYVDSYSFFSGDRFGYIAFFKAPTTGKWVVKSFKKNDEPDPRFFQFREALTKLMGGAQ